MPSKKKAPNIFSASFGSNPPYLAGRQDITDYFLDIFDRLNNPKFDQLRSILLTGPRGCGKTVLLQRIKQDAGKNRVNVLDLNEFTLPDTGQELADLIHRLPARKTTTRSATAGGALIVKGAGTITTTKEPHKPPPSNLFEAFAQHAGRRPLIILLDETHEAPTQLLHDLFRAIQTAASEFPALIVAAGTPDTEHHLDQAKATFTERSRTIRIGLIDEAEAVNSIAKPLSEETDFSIPSAVAVRAARESQCYPYFLQATGEAIIDIMNAHDGTVVTDSILDQALARARPATATLYNSRISTLRTHLMLAGAAEVALNTSPGGAPSRSTVNTLINALARRWRADGTSPPRGIPADNLVTAAEHLLLHTCFAWQPDSANPSEWAFGIPSLAQAAVNEATEIIHEKLNIAGAPRALRHLVDQGADHAASLPDLAEEIAPVLDNHRVNADRFINDMHELGVIGPDGTTDPAGQPRYALITPALASHALDSP